jgi:hypothetical protein
VIVDGTLVPNPVYRELINGGRSRDGVGTE